MPKPRRRRRFFALEGRLEIDDSGEPQGIAEPASAEPLTTAPAGEVEEASHEEIAPEYEELAEEFHPSESSVDNSLPRAFQLNREPRDRPAPRRLFSFPVMLIGLLCLSTGTFAGYLWAKATQKPAVVDASADTPKEATPLTAEDQSDLDAAYFARHAHHFAEAERIFKELVRRHADWGPIQVEIGRTLFYANSPYDANASLRKAVEKGWKPAEANFLMAVMNKARKAYAESEACFAKAVDIDPTEPDYYFFWGECLREQGKLLDATAKFRSALLRNQYETATGLYRAKLWLCAIEADQAASNGVDAEVDTSLAQPHPPIEAFVAAAARDIKAGNLHAAAAHLASASQRSDPVVFRYIINDPFFAEANSRPEFAGLFEAEAPVASPKTEAVASSPKPAAAH